MRRGYGTTVPHGATGLTARPLLRPTSTACRINPGQAPAVRLGFTYVRRRIVDFKSRRGGFARSGTQLFDNAIEDRFFLTQGLQPLVLLGFDDFLSQFGDVEFK